ncbi:response regulator transcription factor [Azospirillum sp. SYSU D00513]|uniref:LuxR C-terminal-related transcriptional regulator n=1 Tax=Azospirillum sp. SYSU D00513 TaxID=2812561 RepID=UPI001A95A366|nr:response regulator transcription factor [Azospirillum sp. SYSU D00513]
MKPATVFLIDSNRLFREGLKRLFEGTAFTVIGEAGTLDEATSALAASGKQPELVLMDVASVAEQEIALLRSVAPQARAVVLSNELCTQRLSGALRAGVHGYLVKDIACEALLQSLQLVLLGEKVFPTNLAELLLSGVGRGDLQPEPSGRKGLSQREMQILQTLVKGSSNKMIANHLGITEATVKVHLKSLLRKINASNRTQAAIWAMNNGIGDEVAGVAATV